MKIRHLLSALGGIGVLGALIVGSLGYWGGGQLGDSLAQAVLSTQAVQASGEADMMHDAVRGDVLAALLAAERGDAASLGEARDALNEDGGKLLERLAQIKQMPLPPAVIEQVNASIPTATEYVAMGRAVQDLAQKDRAAALAKLPQFQATFARLEQSLSKPGEAIEALVRAGEAQAKDRMHLVNALVVAGTVAAALALAVLSALAIRRVTSGIDLASRFAQTVASGDLSAGVQGADRADEVGDLMRAMHEMQSRLAGLVGQVRQMAESVASASQQIAQGNEDLAQRTEQQAGSLQTTAAAMEQMSAAVQTNSEHAVRANQLTTRASGVAERGGQEVARVVDTMQGITEASRRIADIIGVIDGIAFQTNILALNAAVEAARAGEAGRGFAVVASEVRALAGRSAEAAKEIKELILASTERVEQGTALVDQAGTTMHDVVDAIRQVNDIMGEITSATQEQRSGIQSVTDAVSELDQSTVQNSALVEESAAAAASLSDLSRQLVELVAVFRIAAGQRSALPALTSN